MTALGDALEGAVLVSWNIPAHDETCDLVQEIGDRLDAFHGYVASVRTAEQADVALLELADAIRSVVAR